MSETYSPYVELLAYDGIEHAVDQAFRAYLDSCLVKLAIENRKLDDYRKKVEDLADSMQLRDPSVPECGAFIYWFEIRADYWWHASDADRAYLQTLIAPQNIQWLHAEARALRDRLNARTALRPNVTGPSVGVVAGAHYAAEEPAAEPPTQQSRARMLETIIPRPEPSPTPPKEKEKGGSK